MSGQPDYSGSAMLALYPDPDTVAALALPGGLNPDDLHVTVVYVGEAADVDPVALNTVAQQLSRRGGITAKVSGLARFVGGKQDVHVALIDSPQVEDLRRDALDRCRAQGITVPREHGYCAHTTLRYLEPSEPSPANRIEPRTAAFTAVSAVHGNNRTDYPLDDDPAVTIPALAREAYARGFARTGGPLTERVKAGCAAAVRLAREHPHDPDILEVTLKLGSLEGTWARVYQRRDALIANRADKANAAWKTVLTRDMLAGAVSDFRRRAGLTETDQADDDRKQQLAADALAAAAAMMRLLPDRPEWRSLRKTLRDSLAAGRAEGAVDAVALAAERIDRVGLDWDIALQDAYNALADLDTLWAEADGWLTKMLGRATADLGRALAHAAMSNATYAQTLAVAMDALDSDDVEAVSFITDWATTTALGRGALDLYLSEGVAAVDWLTAGDARVCTSPCEDNETGGPYAPGGFPDFPGHPRCRCTPASSAPFGLGNYDAWFTAA